MTLAQNRRINREPSPVVILSRGMAVGEVSHTEARGHRGREKKGREEPGHSHLNQVALFASSPVPSCLCVRFLRPAYFSRAPRKKFILSKVNKSDVSSVLHLDGNARLRSNQRPTPDFLISSLRPPRPCVMPLFTLQRASRRGAGDAEGKAGRIMISANHYETLMGFKDVFSLSPVE